MIPFGLAIAAVFPITVVGFPLDRVDTAQSRPPDCYDVTVVARPVEQIPSVAPECADCFVMRWPWFLDLEVSRVVDGSLDDKLVRPLSVQHTWFVPRRGRWPLRRNSAGGFNVPSSDDDKPLRRCPADAGLARPYITPGDGKTLDDLRDEGLARYGPAPR